MKAPRTDVPVAAHPARSERSAYIPAEPSLRARLRQPHEDAAAIAVADLLTDPVHRARVPIQTREGVRSLDEIIRLHADVEFGVAFGVDPDGGVRGVFIGAGASDRLQPEDAQVVSLAQASRLALVGHWHGKVPAVPSQAAEGPSDFSHHQHLRELLEQALGACPPFLSALFAVDVSRGAPRLVVTLYDAPETWRGRSEACAIPPAQQLRALGLEPDAFDSVQFPGGVRQLPHAELFEALRENEQAESTRAEALGGPSNPVRFPYADPYLLDVMGLPAPRYGLWHPDAVDDEARQTLEFVAARQLAVERVREIPLEGELDLYPYAYGGSGTGTSLGSGRSALAPMLGLDLKGVRNTHFAAEVASDFQHGHGGLSLVEAGVEVIGGRVCAGLLDHRTTRVLAVADDGSGVRWPNGSVERTGVAARAGKLARYGLLYEDRQFLREDAWTLLPRLLQVAGLLPHGAYTPKALRRGLSSLVDAQAALCASQRRWRVLHGAVSESNLGMGSMLDFGTFTTQPRTAPIYVLSHKEHHGYSKEHFAVKQVLVNTLRRLLRHPGVEQALRAERGAVLRLASDAGQRFDRAFKEALTRETLGAAGFNGQEAALLVKRKARKQAEAFQEAFWALAARTLSDASFDADQQVVEHASTVDVFNFLRFYPAAYFAAHAEGPPNAQGERALVEQALKLLAVDPDTPSNHLQELVEATGVLCARYHALMQAAGSIARPEAIVARAEFENRPLDRLYRGRLRPELIDQVDRYQRSGDAPALHRFFEEVIADSQRNLDVLVREGEASAINGGVELTRRWLHGVGYSLFYGDGPPALKVRLPVREVLRDGMPAGYRMVTLPGEPELTGAQLSALQYRFSTDRWGQGSKEAHAATGVAPRRPTELDRVLGALETVDGEQFWTFSIPVQPLTAGQLEGAFHLPSDDRWFHPLRGENFIGYAFWVPEPQEAKALVNAYAQADEPLAYVSSSGEQNAGPSTSLRPNGAPRSG